VTQNRIEPTLRSYRMFLLMTQGDMARILNISRQSYSNKERGVTPFTDNEKLKIRNIIRKVDKSVTIDDIFFGF